jgi:serine/threonine protein phosphatase PrpC
MLLAKKKLAISDASFSYIGKRENNEDSILALKREDRFCFAVADGLGGHGFGDVASRLLVEAFAAEFENAACNCKFIARAFETAQEKISTLKQGKTTAAVLSIIGNKCAWGHLGDSRLYYFRRGKLKMRTFDHSIPQMLVALKEIKPDEIATHPDRSRLLCAFGDDWNGQKKYEISKEITLRKGSAFLLCTDGIWEHVSDRNIAPAKNANADEWLASVKNQIDENSDIDNYSAIAILINQKV